MAGLEPDLLRRMAENAANGRLPWPPTELSFDQMAPDKARCALLLDLAANSTDPDAFSRTLQLLAGQVELARGQAPRITLVATGPDDHGRTRPTLAVVNELFGAAKRSVLVSGFAVHQGQSIFAALAERLDQDQGLCARLILNVPRASTDTSSSDAIIAKFSDRFKSQVWPGQRLPELYYDPRALVKKPAEAASFHAKCIVVDGQCALVTSANPTEAAYERNIELGLMIYGGGCAATIENWFDSLIVDRHLERLPVV